MQDVLQSVHDVCELPQTRAALRIAVPQVELRMTAVDLTLRHLHGKLCAEREFWHCTDVKVHGNGGNASVACSTFEGRMIILFTLCDVGPDGLYIKLFLQLLQAVAKVAPIGSIDHYVYFGEDEDAEWLPAHGYQVHHLPHSCFSGASQRRTVPEDWYISCPTWHSHRWKHVKPYDG